MKIEVWSDFSCPFCYLGKTRLEKAVSHLGLQDEVELEFRSFLLNPFAPKTTELRGAAAFAKQKDVSKAEAEGMFTQVSTLFQQEGLDANMDNLVMTSTLDAHRLAKYARSQHKENVLSNRLLQAYFRDGLNLADHEVLLDIAEQSGLNREEAKAVLASEAYLDTVNAEIAQARSFGVSGVPFFVLEDKYSISGAQPQEYFNQAIEQVWKESHPLTPLGSTPDGVCSDGSCSLN